MLHSDSPRHRLIGIGFISLTYLCFTLLDGSAKWLVRQLPVIEVVWLRFLTHAVLTTAFLLPRHGTALFRVRRPGPQTLRVVMLITMTSLNFTALQYLQLSVTSSIFFSSPLIVALLSAPMLGERLDARRLAAIALGFTGVLVIVQPGATAFHPAMLLSVLNAFIYALFNMLTRKLAAYDSPEAMNVLPAIGASLVLAPFALAAWQAPHTWVEWLVACLLGIFGSVGHHFLVVAHRYAPASVLAPFMYPGVVYMAVFGYVVFGDVPRAATLAGAPIIIASGMYLFWREGRR